MNNVNFLHKNNFEEPFEEKPKKSRKKWLFLLSTIIFLSFTVYGYNYAQQIRDSLNPLDYNETTLEPKKPEGILQKIAYLLFKPEAKLAGQKENRINVLLLGMGGLGHDGPYLTDTIMIVSIEPSTHEVAFISIPRDLGVNIDNYGVRKINSANSIGETKQANWGGAYATEVISKTFDIDIPYYVRIDFQAFSEIIDEVGGVRVDVENPFTDYLYPTDNDLYQTVSFTKGTQTMDGETALKYSRSRHGNNGEGSDFARAKRQQKIIQALKDKILSFSTLTNPVKIKKIMDDLEKHMTTNMQFDEILSFVRMAKEVQNDSVKHLVLDTSVNGYLNNYTGIDGAFLLGPKTGNFDNINNAIKNIFTDESLTKVEEYNTDTIEQEAPKLDGATIEIQNGSWQAGLAARLKQRLLDEKFYVEDVGNVDVSLKPISVSAIYTNPTSSKDLSIIVKALEKELHITSAGILPTNISPIANSTDIVIVLGDDFVE
ncbi:MAG: hypothetical protein A2493_01915 [Candidatus Magasanikbacteria bacterium RIFOXYC12_FULL_33_11]|uniref:Cell envelope-related transcriptional attenuator domain-containing protein n=1 Tax=Candidatus Magasanikbacteria bacterium RIFOXYC12_FULL_33_11 TaxID=1798701 RepID=A0A1F6NLT6_9BACT|nr:MAG: hypothetical protein A2493_01915 [Candidatus Magasanikbacteria bacterium RIFOXYC12_FULL_33_11]